MTEKQIRLDTLILIWRIAYWCVIALVMFAVLALLASPLLQLFGIDLFGGINNT